MSLLVRGARILVLLAASCCVCAHADAPPAEPRSTIENDGGETAIAYAIGPGHNRDEGLLPKLAALAPAAIDRDFERTTTASEPFGLQVINSSPSPISARWVELQSRILSERETLAACRSGGICPSAARQFLRIVELGRQHEGRARLGVINRAVNLGIRPVSDWAQYGVEDFWSAPLATLSAGAGDCEDYAIVKYVALREAGIAPDDLRLVIVRVDKRETVHAVVAVRLDEEWLILDNRMLIMVNAMSLPQYHPVFILDHRGTREFTSAALTH